jgi:predicted P-loop ATPase
VTEKSDDAGNEERAVIEGQGEAVKRKRGRPKLVVDNEEVPSPRSHWPGGQTKEGNAVSNLANTLFALEQLPFRYSYNLFKCRITVTTPMGGTIELSDNLLADLTKEILRDYNFDPTKYLVWALLIKAREHQFHPVRDYLDSLQWDGVKRLDNWLNKAMGAPATKLNTAVGRLWMIGAVRRVRKPGCKFDTALILEGKVQGRGKSEGLRILTRRDEWFSDQEIIDLSSQKLIEQTEGKWICELSELEAMKKADNPKVKSFLSRQFEGARMAWGKVRDDRPRQFVCAGTTNEEDYLNDPTGNRRFLIVVTDEINLDWLRANVDQLWAEAAAAEAAGESIVLPKEFWHAMALLQASRTPEDGWIEILRQKLDKNRYHTVGLLDLLEVRMIDRTAFVTRRLGKAMRPLKFEGPKKVSIPFDVLDDKGNKVRTDRKLAQGYIRRKSKGKSPKPDEPDDSIPF